MKKEEIEKNMKGQMEAPLPPVRFTIDGEPFEFAPLPLGTLLLVETMKDKLNLNRRLLDAAPLMAWVLAAKRHTDELRTIVALLTIQGEPKHKIKERVDFLREHCSAEDLCSLFIIGTALQNLWMRDAGTETSPSDYEGISHRELFLLN